MCIKGKWTIWLGIALVLLSLVAFTYEKQRMPFFEERVSETLFFEDFSENLDNWTTVSGTWRIEDGKLRGDSMDRGVILYNGDVGTDYEITSKVYVIGSPPVGRSVPSYWQTKTGPEAQIVFRYGSSGNFYFAGLGAYGYKGAIGSFVNRDAMPIASGGNGNYIDVQTNTWYDLKVVVKQATMEVWINAEKVVTTTNETHSSGQVGLTTIFSSVYFDDFTVKELSSFIPASPSSPRPSRLHVNGSRIEDEFGRTVYLKGVNFYTTEWWNKEYGTEEQIIYMKEWGSNVVAISIAGWAIGQGLVEDPAFLGRLDNMISWAEKHGMYVVLKFMSGMQIVRGFPGPPDQWTTDADWRAWIDFWKKLATRYKGRTSIAGYDIINEPLKMPSYEFYSARIRECVDTIRAIDSELIVIVQATSLDRKYENLSFEFEQTNPINRPNIVFSGHMYQSEHSGGFGYTKDFIRNRMANWKWDWIVNNNRCLWIGEFNTENSFIGDPTYNGEVWLRNFMQICNEDGYAGFCAWWWNAEGGTPSPHALITDWNGTPSASGGIIKEYLR